MSKRIPLWDSERSSQYWESQDVAAKHAEAKKYGEYTAADLDGIWATLNDDERALLEYLILRDRRSLVALYEDALCNALVEKKLLQIPAGVGTLLMQNLETTFKIPRAVWREMRARKHELFAGDDIDAGTRLQEVTARIAAHIRAKPTA